MATIILTHCKLDTFTKVIATTNNWHPPRGIRFSDFIRQSNVRYSDIQHVQAWASHDDVRHRRSSTSYTACAWSPLDHTPTRSPLVNDLGAGAVVELTFGTTIRLPGESGSRTILPTITAEQQTTSALPAMPTHELATFTALSLARPTPASHLLCVPAPMPSLMPHFFTHGPFGIIARADDPRRGRPRTACSSTWSRSSVSTLSGGPHTRRMAATIRYTRWRPSYRRRIFLMPRTDVAPRRWTATLPPPMTRSILAPRSSAWCITYRVCRDGRCKSYSLKVGFQDLCGNKTNNITDECKNK